MFDSESLVNKGNANYFVSRLPWSDSVANKTLRIVKYCSNPGGVTFNFPAFTKITN